MKKTNKRKKINKKMVGTAVFLIAGTIAATRLISIGQQWEESQKAPQQTPEWVKEELAKSAAQREAEAEQAAENEKLLSGAEEYQKKYEEEQAEALNSNLEELREAYDDYVESPKATTTSSTTSATSTIQVEAAEVEGFPEYSDETYLLSQILYCEAGGQGKAEMSYVGSVVINRARTDYHDFRTVDTIQEVLYQGYGTSAQQYAEETINKIEDGIEPSVSVQVAIGRLERLLPLRVDGHIGIGIRNAKPRRLDVDRSNIQRIRAKDHDVDRSDVGEAQRIRKDLHLNGLHRPESLNHRGFSTRKSFGAVGMEVVQGLLLGDRALQKSRLLPYVLLLFAPAGLKIRLHRP